jgi:uncharacterized protein
MGLSYIDSSALLKRYSPELGSDWIEAFMQTEMVAVSQLASAEVASALGRRTREGQLNPDQRNALFDRFVEDLRNYTILPLTSEVIERAATMLLRGADFGRLRTLDALQLATAEIVFAIASRGGIEVGRFISADRRLLAAAANAGLGTANPEDFP